MSSPVLSIEGLRVLRGETTILRNLSWRVEHGQNWVVLGPNGCGKTTLLKTLTGYMTASAGRMELLGHVYGTCDWRDLRLHVGIVSSSLQASIPPGEVALETVVSGRYAQLDLWARPTRADRNAALRKLSELGIRALAERSWIFLSQGERQKVLIARALMARPRLLILDEPCSGLDPVAREHFLAFVEKLALLKQAPALVLVTHHVEEIVPAFSHALFLRGGAAVAAGPLARTLTSATLCTTFGAPLRLTRTRGRYALKAMRLEPGQRRDRKLRSSDSR